MSSNTESRQTTVKRPILWQGRGLHSGAPCKVEVHPAPENHGFRFYRMDADAEKMIKADTRFVVDTNRSTTLGIGDISIGTVEHLLAALVGAGIHNAKIEVTGPEVPILDGSAGPFYNELKDAVEEQEKALVGPWLIREVIEYTCPESGAEYTIMPSDKFEVSVSLDYPSVNIGQQYSRFKEGDSFASLAQSRTFVLTSELAHLAKQNLIKGGDVKNAVLIADGDRALDDLKNALESLEHSNAEEIIAQFEAGQALNAPDELVKHKIVDLIGDLSLLGYGIRGKIMAHKPGHKGNAALVKHLKPMMQKALKLRGLPVYHPAQKPILDTVQIQGYLPHRYPFLMVDKIIELSDKHVVGIKNITFNEGLFQGHFPNNPVFPGVLQMEALAQTGGLLALSTVENPSEWDTYFLKMDQVKFKRKVLPGDTLILRMDLIAPIRRGIVQMFGTTYVGDQIASEGELTAQIVNRNTL